MSTFTMSGPSTQSTSSRSGMYRSRFNKIVKLSSVIGSFAALTSTSFTSSVYAEDAVPKTDPLAECNTNLQQMQQQALGLQEQCNQQMGQLNGMIGGKDQEIQVLQGKLDEANTAKTAALSEKDAVVSEKEQLTAHVTTLTAEIEVAKQGSGAASEEADKKVAAAEAKVTEVEAKVVEVEAQKVESEKKVVELENSLKELQSVIVEFEKTSKKAEQDVDSEKKKISQMEKEFEEKLIAEKKKVASVKKEMMGLQSELKSVTQKLEEVSEAAAKSSAGVVDKYVGTTKRIFGDVLYSGLILPQYEPFVDVASKHYQIVVKESGNLFSVATVVVTNLYNEAVNIASDVYEQHLSPTYVLVKIEAKKLYNAHLAEPAKPVWEEIEKLELEKHYEVAYDMGMKYKEEALTIVNEQVLPLTTEATSFVQKTVSDLKLDDHVSKVKELDVSGLYEQLKSTVVNVEVVSNTYEDVKNTVFAPVSMKLTDIEGLDDEVVFENGIFDIIVFLSLSLAVWYFLVYKIVIKVIVFKLLFKFLLYNVIYKFLFKGLLVSLVIGVTYSLLSFTLSLAIFLIKLAFCCGCCGACFRRNKASSVSKKGGVASKANPVTKTNSGSKSQLSSSKMTTSAAAPVKQQKIGKKK